MHVLQLHLHLGVEDGLEWLVAGVFGFGLVFVESDFIKLAQCLIEGNNLLVVFGRIWSRGLDVGGFCRC